MCMSVYSIWYSEELICDLDCCHESRRSVVVGEITMIRVSVGN